MKIITTFLLSFLLTNSPVWAQFAKDDWLLDFQLNTSSEFTELANGRIFLNEENLQLKCGRFLSNNFVGGLTYSLIKSGNRSELESFGITSFSTEEHKFGGFCRYYFGRKPEQKLLFIKGNLTWSYTSFQVSQIDTDFSKELLFTAGMGLSLFKFPNAAIEMWLDYNLLGVTGSGLRERASFGEGRLIFYTQFQIYLNREFKSKWVKQPTQFLQKGRKIISGSIKYNGINTGVFTHTTTIDIHLGYGKFISKRWLIGATTPIKWRFVSDQINFDIGIGPFARYYQPLTERLQVFGHIGLTSNFVGNNFNKNRGFRTGKWDITKDLQTTFGLGMNLFLNEHLSAFWLYKYTVPKEFSAIDLEYWEASRSTLSLEMGLGFWF